MKKVDAIITVSRVGLLLFTLLSTAQSSAVDPALTRIHSGGGVTAKVTYLNPEGTEDTRFEISLRHSFGEFRQLRSQSVESASR